MGDTSSKYRLEKIPEYLSDVGKQLPVDPVWVERLARRERKIVENPEHHGYDMRGRNHCKWAAGVGPYYVVYEIKKDSTAWTIRFLAFYKP